jgi:hypothetical protein
MRLTLARKLEAVKRETVMKRKIIPSVCLARPVQADREGMDEIAGTGDESRRLSSSEVLRSKSKSEVDAEGLRVVIEGLARESSGQFQIRGLVKVISVDACTSKINKRTYRNSMNMNSNVFYRYFDQYDYFDHSQILIFIFSSRRRHRRRHQYEIIQKMFYETSLNIAKIYLFVISIQNNQSCRIFRIFFFSIHFYFHSLTFTFIRIL